MRLIDADAMLKRLEEWNRSDSIDNAFYSFCLNRIIEQPTSYDVEKVVEELEEEVEKSTISGMGGISCNIDETKIIDIVKRGGVK